MKVVILKNGEKFKVSEKQAEAFVEFANGCVSYQFANIESEQSKLMINIDEVAAIISSENVI